MFCPLLSLRKHSRQHTNGGDGGDHNRGQCSFVPPHCHLKSGGSTCTIASATVSSTSCVWYLSHLGLLIGVRGAQSDQRMCRLCAAAASASASAAARHPAGTRQHAKRLPPSLIPSLTPCVLRRPEQPLSHMACSQVSRWEWHNSACHHAGGRGCADALQLEREQCARTAAAAVAVVNGASASSTQNRDHAHAYGLIVIDTLCPMMYRRVWGMARYERRRHASLCGGTRRVTPKQSARGQHH